MMSIIIKIERALRQLFSSPDADDADHLGETLRSAMAYANVPSDWVRAHLVGTVFAQPDEITAAIRENALTQALATSPPDWRDDVLHIVVCEYYDDRRELILIRDPVELMESSSVVGSLSLSEAAWQSLSEIPSMQLARLSNEP